MGSGKQAARFAVALIGAAVTVLGVALPAAAATSGVVDGHDQDGPSVALHYIDSGAVVDAPMPTSLIGVRLPDGHEVKTYCVQLTVNAQPNAPMDEVPWAQYPQDPNSHFTPDLAKVNWAVHHSYPAVAVTDIGAAAGVGGLTPDEAIAGTQAAIWHFSNGAVPSATEADQHVLAAYGYLTGPRNTGAPEPASTLTITPDRRTGRADDKVGPFTVDTTATSGRVRLDAPAGVTLVDAHGTEIPAGTPGPLRTAGGNTTNDVFVQVPKALPPGTAKLTLDGQAVLDTGRLLVGHGPVKTQALIVAKPAPVAVSGSAAGAWTAAGAAPATPGAVGPAAPTDPAHTVLGLPDVLVWALGVLAVLLLAAGIAALLARRRRQSSSA